ncbi:MAG: octanoyltransferase [Planctomycetes bacterium]|nr:octanoyltransferase [Planctomycetota bacterium]
MLHVEDLGRISYEAARELQLARLAERVRGEVPDTLFLVEHLPVVTLGRGTDPENLRDRSRFPVVESERGGDATLHAPGQLVGYLIRRLDEGQRDLHAHLRLLEEIVIRSLDGVGLAAGRRDGATGVWVEGRKIASLGVACRNWCTWHGFALNVGIDLSLFEAINPCGFEADVMTSVDVELGHAVAAEDVKSLVADAARGLLADAR